MRRYTSMYDLVLRGGRVIDPGNSIDEALDIAMTGDRIARIAPNIDPSEARRWVDVGGKLVVPGLIDIHTHVYHHGARNGLDPDLAGVESGVTTLVDAGSAGSATYEGFHHHVVTRAKTKVYTNIHIARYGIAHVPEANTLADIDIDATVETISRYPEIVGVKVRACGPVVEDHGLAPLEAAAQAARKAGVRLMVHIGDANFGRSAEITRQLLPLLEAGDLLTHVYTGAPGRVIDDHGKVVPELLEAQKRGVILDPAHGRYNLSFKVARLMIDQGVIPFTVSTDITRPGRDIVGSMTHTMGRFLALGFSLNDVVQMSTHNPADLLGNAHEIGTLSEGTVADIAVLEVVDGTWWFRDGEGEWLAGNQALRPILTFKSGDQISPDFGPFPGGWLPEVQRPR
ncbi:MAG: amidohydrolase/deacetylase family metallohydrolase [Acidimicrobiia bacterium]|nr:amidohydrolase/deacetylase family metallohydrolase [Acidimicrobiia bacterium]